MIQKFLGVLIEGDLQPVESAFDKAVQTALNALEPALDYELLALRVHAVVNTLWPLMIRTYEQLEVVLAAWPGPGNTNLQQLRASIRNKVAFFQNESVFNDETIRRSREAMLEDMFRKSGEGLGLIGTELDLFRCTAPTPPPDSAQADSLHRLLRTQLFSHPDEDTQLAALGDVLIHYFAREQGIVRAATAIQEKINCLLGRAQPLQPLLASDINLYFLMQDGPRRLPYLVREEISGILNIQAEITAQHMSFSQVDK